MLISFDIQFNRTKPPLVSTQTVESLDSEKEITLLLGNPCSILILSNLSLFRINIPSPLVPIKSNSSYLWIHETELDSKEFGIDCS